MRFPSLSPRRLRQLWYVPLLVLAMALMMLRMLVMARLVDVPTFAEFSGGMLVSATFCMLGCLGLQSMLQREWPVNLVRRQELRALVRAAQCAIVAAACCALGLLAAGLGLKVAGMSPALLAVGLLSGLSQQLFLIATVESRSRGEALRFSLQNLLRAVAALGLSVLVAVTTGSALAALAVDALVTIALSAGYFQRSLAHVKWSALAVGVLALRRLRRVQWRSALTLMVVMVVGFALLNADRWVASEVLGTIGFAHYSFAWIVLSIAQSAQVVINASMYPMLARRFAEHGRGVAFRVCLRACVALLVLGAVAAVPLGLLLDFSVRRWYPQFVDATALLPIFLAIAVLRVSDFWSSFLLITGFESRLLRLNVAVAIGGAIVWALIVRPGTGTALSPTEVAGLAAVFTLGAYAAAAGAAWRVRSA